MLGRGVPRNARWTGRGISQSQTMLKNSLYGGGLQLRILHPSERIALARREQLNCASFLKVILGDEVNRRAHRRIEIRLHSAGFQETCRLEDFNRSASITLDRRLLYAAFPLEFLSKHEHVLLVGPAGVGKSFLAQARVDNSVDRTPSGHSCPLTC